jgi:hypothetical protein
MLAEPPSEVGTDGGQTVEEEAAWLAVAAVEVADWVEVFGVSPGSCNGTWDVFDEDALMLDAPARSDVAADAPKPAEEPEGNGCVGTLSGSEPVPVVDAV